jgi:hypothetical protein
MKLSDLVRDPGTGMLSHTKIWANVGYFALTWAFMADAAAGHLTDMKIFAYGAVMAGSAVASKLLSMRYGGAGDIKPPEEGQPQ